MQFKIIHRLAHFLINALLMLFVIEITLQCASLILNYQLNKRIRLSKSTVMDRHNSSLPIQVLCVGDSYTQGVGASELKYSYPMLLQEYLHKNSSLPWAVANCGKAGTNSSELVQYIPKLFEMYSPKYLCVLIGVNDSWNSEFRNSRDPGKLETTSVVPWRLRFRTYRLFCMLNKYMNDIQATRQSLNKSKYADPRAAFSKNEKIENGLSIDQLTNRANVLFNAGRFSEAGEVLEKVIRQYPEYNNIVSIEIEFSNALVEQKRMGDAFKYACIAQKRIAGQASQCHNALAWLFMRLCKFELAYNEIEQYKRFFPANQAGINTLLGNYYFETYNYPEAEKYFHKALKDNPQAPFVMRTIARIYSFKESKLLDAKKMLMRAYAVDRNRSMTELYLGIVDSSAGDRFQEILKQPTIIPEMDRHSYGEFIEISKEFVRRQGGTDLLRANLSIIASLCLKYNVALLLITYPCPYHKEVNSIIRQFCADNNIMIFDAENIFRTLLQHQTYDTYFVIDSHPNNKGYAVMAQEAGDLLMSHQARLRHTAK